MNDEVKQFKSEVTGVILTERARNHVANYLMKRGKGLGLRLSVSTTGCSGLSYVVDYVDEVNESDLCFDFDNNYKIYIAKEAYPYLKGVEIDYVKQGLNHKFVFKNPNQTGECGCGESFTVD